MTKITLTDKKGQAGGLEVPNLRDPVADTDAANKRFVDAQLVSKVDKVAGKGLSSEDFTTAEKAKLAAISAEETASKAFVDAQLVSKVDKVAGKGLSSEDFTTAEKAKLAEVVMLLKGYWDQSAPLPVADSSNKGFTYFVTVEGNGYRAGEVITSTGVTWEKTTLSDLSLSVVGCVVSMLDPLPELLNATVSLEGSALLSGAVVSFFTVTDWVNGTHTVPAVANKATLTLAVPEYPCDPLSITVVAVDNYSNKSKVVTRTIAVQDTITMPPVPVVPVVPVVPIASLAYLTFTSSALAISNGSTDVHVSTDWELWGGAGRTGTLVWSSISDTVNKTSVSVPATVLLAVSSKYYLVVRYRSLTYGLSSYTEASFLTSSQQVPVMGEPFQGGYYSGRFTLGGSIYALVVAPKAQGENYYPGSLVGDYYNVTTTGTSVIDGLANSNKGTASGNAAEKFCRSLTIGGFTDWYMPSYYELELMYFYLSPSKYASRTPYVDGRFSPVMYGGNPYSVPARPYTTYALAPPRSDIPFTTTIADVYAHYPTYASKFFCDSPTRTEEFTYTTDMLTYYLSSSYYCTVVGGSPLRSIPSTYAIGFIDGYHVPYMGSNAPFRVRATRKVLIS